jgi:ABC-type uncharacterized transport system substrate-binding protein
MPPLIPSLSRDERSERALCSWFGRLTMSGSMLFAAHQSIARVLLPLLLIFAFAGAVRAEIAVVVDQNVAEIDALVTAVRRGAGSQTVRLYDLRSIPRTNAIERGRFLARIAGADLVVPLGSNAASFIADEIEDAKTFFVGGGSLSGEYLRLSNIAGILPYDPDEVVRVIKGLRPGIRTIGIASTRGYEPIVAEVRSAAQTSGLRIVEATILARKDVGPAIRTLASSADVLWLLGDPIVGSGAGLQLVVESALSLRKPVVGSSRRQIDAGALFYVAPDPVALGLLTDRSIREIVAGGFRFPSRRIVTGPSGGTVTYHGPLAERLGVSFESAARAERIR